MELSRGRGCAGETPLCGGGAGKRCQFGNVIAFPDPQQENLLASRIFENVKDIVLPFDFKESRPSRVRLRRRAVAQQPAQLNNLLLRVVVQVFDEGRSFCNGNHDVFNQS
jgi:hypothetical protein